MTLLWNQTNLGGRMILIAALLAVASIFMPWVDAGPFYRSYGYQQLAYVLLAFYLYPLFVLIKNRSMSLFFGLGSSIIAAVASVVFMEWRTVSWKGADISLSGLGTLVFFAAALLLFAGVLKYAPSVTGNIAEEESVEEKAEEKSE